MAMREAQGGRRLGAAAPLLLTAAALAALVVPAAARSLRIADFQTTAVIAENGVTTVHERITVTFLGHWNGIYRTIPIRYPGPHGSNYTLFLDVRSVTDGAGTPLRYESSVVGDSLQLKVWVPQAEDATRTVEIEYVARNAIRYFPDHDEFYWNVTGNESPVPTEHASALVELPAAAAGGLRAQAFTGVYGSTSQEATAQVEGSTCRFETSNPLPMYGGFTVDIFIPKGVLRQPGVLTRAGWFLRSNPVLLLPLVALLVMFTMWWTMGRDPDPGRSIAPVYEPPAQMTPSEAGALLDDSVDPRDITAILVDLAVRGYVKITEVKEEHWFGDNKDYQFDLLKPMPQWQELAPYERVMLENVFGGGQRTRLSSLRNRFYTALPMIKDDIRTALKSKKMYRLDPESAHHYTVAGAILVAVPFVLAQWMGIADLFRAPVLTFFCIVAALVIAWLFGRQMSAKSFLGARTWVAIRGFQEFMNRVDADRLQRMPPDTFEKYLPYAMALGVEHHWAQAFAGIIKQPPNWYQSTDGGMFNPIFFTNSLGGMSRQAQQTFVSAPRASSTGSGWSGGGGFGGGGFSGGGFGGGGVGGF